MNYSFHGPSLAKLGLSIPGAVVLGGVYATVVKTAFTPILLLVIREIADYALYNLLTMGLDEDQNAKNCAEVYAVANLCVNVATLFLFYNQKLIGKIGVIASSLFIVFEVVCKVTDFPRYRVEILEV